MCCGNHHLLKNRFICPSSSPRTVNLAASMVVLFSAALQYNSLLAASGQEDALPPRAPSGHGLQLQISAR
ncbi:hypothetical protein CHLRE_12g556913v5 [Chlamydomonas reinhardtii]|uniref:Uncharacterized protein n=1 Tax=Chlamydomonas reinhardtii TaxID=3055 RepID=A0A2K3D5S4_CHLRE|nr:uncharacterized protein CHLRE_12g556912v5 [Chlamydomonas reinhardtii]XP_042918895.1 uncharacterized protein CHLRE_12g556912v5 [Chlamydomonas reinhardtii]XP_042918896.1 uncharacterized protein CHLRE_12g556912v5 [Chlamydomonas reinhardtii]XP_042918897.1 uncharacterized protein CHLRE_12g556913v5 [Chlamydomonas reinhardtii]PNW75873.1 hypothetical protein CHLRE_12g556912v5 [Chlamydomonas reinhardtii]PNW75874.1 hypothetical protein CHLRE_12g556912v5 [Chlamydomonas reinhardtii]PNW75875.1 hypothet